MQFSPNPYPHVFHILFILHLAVSKLKLHYCSHLYWFSYKDPKYL